ncbi:DUF222 domain-containing protein [Williamsia sp. MIQD14]|uniref:HNH endonuclease signature motif containing protein n=1 Tax=Williamsia sp. MIQD14 TaxID=3425703 RepID=UPI003DA10B0D
MSVIAWPVEPIALSDMLFALEETVDELQARSMSTADSTELRAALQAVERIGRKLGVVSHTTITEIASRGAHSEWGYRRITSMLSGELHLASAEASRRVRVAAATCSTHGVTGDILEPAHFEVAMGVYDGLISEPTADAVLTVLDKIPAAIDGDVRASAEATMVELARDLSPREVSGVGDRLLAHLDPDGSLTGDGDRARQRGLSVSAQDAALMSKLTATLDPATRAMLDVLLDAWAAPGMNNPGDFESPSGSRTDPDTDRDRADAAAARDTRSAPQRRHDALSAMLARVIATGTLGSHNGSPAQVVATMTYDQLLEMAGIADTTTGSQMPVEDVVELARRNSTLFAILDPVGLPLYLGRTKRLATMAQRIADWLRSRGCTFPGCRVAVTRTQAHHLREWLAGGPTDLTNLGAACSDHHPMAGDEPHQWRTELVTEGRYRGRVAWVPPAAIDPTRTPRVNHANHPDELLAQAWERVCDRGAGRLTGDPWLS